MGSTAWVTNWLRVLVAPVATPVRAVSAVAVLAVTAVIVFIAHTA